MATTQFVELVARGRGLERDLVEPIAQGKVWVGTEAVENGLANDLGSLPEALNKAAELASSENWSPLFMKKTSSTRETPF
jgi:Periplasmic serine proteases (ClpP class)